MKEYQLNPTNCVFLGNIGYNAIVAHKQKIEIYKVKKKSDIVDILKSYI